MEPAIATARTRARAAVRAEIIAAARRQLGVDGASALSLRAVTRELGMASSAAYRYFPSRDDLLTALIVEAYDALGEVTEQAARQDTDAFARWLAMGRAIRAWALEHPHEYALIYGSPVPGYQAPQDTIGPASRVTLTLAGVVVDAHSAGELQPPEGPPLGRAMAAEAKRVGRLALPGVPPAVVAAVLVAWTQLFGHVSFELFGQMHGVIEERELLFDFALATMAGVIGLQPRGRRARVMLDPEEMLRRRPSRRP